MVEYRFCIVSSFRAAVKTFSWRAPLECERLRSGLRTSFFACGRRQALPAFWKSVPQAWLLWRICEDTFSSGSSRVDTAFSAALKAAKASAKRQEAAYASLQLSLGGPTVEDLIAERRRSHFPSLIATIASAAWACFRARMRRVPPKISSACYKTRLGAQATSIHEDVQLPFFYGCDLASGSDSWVPNCVCPRMWKVIPHAAGFEPSSDTKVDLALDFEKSSLRVFAANYKLYECLKHSRRADFVKAFESSLPLDAYRSRINGSFAPIAAAAVRRSVSDASAPLSRRTLSHCLLSYCACSVVRCRGIRTVFVVRKSSSP